jgi:hypothetical protein
MLAFLKNSIPSLGNDALLKTEVFFRSGLLQSPDLLALNPLIVSFYRGGACLFCSLELNALQLALPEIEELEPAGGDFAEDRPGKGSITICRRTPFAPRWRVASRLTGSG